VVVHKVKQNLSLSLRAKERGRNKEEKYMLLCFLMFALNYCDFVIVIVIRQKKERSAEETKLGVPDFEFTWELRLIFDKKLDRLKESRFLISRLVTSDAMNLERKMHLKTIIDQYKAPGSFSIHSFIHSFIHSLTHSLTHSTNLFNWSENC
jgi:hypothetical protein